MLFFHDNCLSPNRSNNTLACVRKRQQWQQEDRQNRVSGPASPGWRSARTPSGDVCARYSCQSGKPRAHQSGQGAGTCIDQECIVDLKQIDCQIFLWQRLVFSRLAENCNSRSITMVSHVQVPTQQVKKNTFLSIICFFIEG